ncbi:MAG: response regulator transcription factor [Acidimicrobiia bacterium]
MTTERVVFVVDDDPAVRESLEVLLQSAGLASRAYSNAQEFLDERPGDIIGCLIVDIRMPGLSGLELQEELNRRGSRLPLIILTGHGDVPAAVQALKAGAVDFLQKPFNPESLLDLVEKALNRHTGIRDAEARRAEIASRLDTLTPREREVMALIVHGNANKVVALDLGISERTVELHRSRVMKKMRARSLADLTRMLPGE